MEQERKKRKCHEERVTRRLHAVYTRKMEERKIFLEDLTEFRKQKCRLEFAALKTDIGPRWYQVLSEVQRRSLDTLESCMHKDLLEARPFRTAVVIRELGLYPRPKGFELLSCIYAGRDDPKIMLAHLYVATFGYPIESNQPSYCLNARLLLSAILYLGLNDLIQGLRERYKPDKDVKTPPPKIKPKPDPPVPSPYLQRMVARLNVRPKAEPKHLRPLPNLEAMDDDPKVDPSFVPKVSKAAKQSITVKPSTPPPPPPPPKPKIPKSHCDKLADIPKPFEIFASSSSNLSTQRKLSKKHSGKHLRAARKIKKKKYGLNLGIKKVKRKKMPPIPSTEMENSQYTININGKSFFILGNVVTLPPQGNLIHGGFVYKDNYIVNLNCGYRGFEPPPLPLPCDCVKKYQDMAIKHIHETKCRCRHRYDFGHEDTYPKEEVPFFIKPTAHSPLQFNYHHIFDLDPKHCDIEKRFKKIWETESMLVVGSRKIAEKKKKERKKKTCLGENPQIEDYLRCAIRYMKNHNIAAWLPDLHLVPELIEWMRLRLHGPYSLSERRQHLKKSLSYWQMFDSLVKKGFGHVAPPKNPELFSGTTNWVHKHSLNEKFYAYIENYKIEIYRSHAFVNNLFWRSMQSAEYPNDNFREIFFSYVISNLDYLHVLVPYNAREALDRMRVIADNRVPCMMKYQRSALT